MTDASATHDWSALAERVADGAGLNREQALAIIRSGDDELLSVLNAAFRLRLRFYGRKVRLHVLNNAKSGLCPEDCGFCSQSLKHHGEAQQYPMKSVDDLVEGAVEAVAMGAVTYCMVTSTRGPSSRDAQTICDAATRIKQRFPNLRLCASLGLLKPGQAETLVAAGIDRYNHNLETSQRYFSEVVSTHSFHDRVDTIRTAKSAGMEACCGGILGMGESDEDRVDLALTLRELCVDSIPINFLDPRPGTPLSARPRLSAQQALRALALFRFAHPSADLRVAGGREVTLGTLQPLALFPANSMFTNGYLTTPGAEPSADAKMIREAGFEPEEVPA